MIIFEYIFWFLLWTFIIYWIHRISHMTPVLGRLHIKHHSYVRNHDITWHWTNIFLYNDDWGSTVDYWVTEVIPTFLFSWLTGQWWLIICFYFYGAFIQEWVEHNKNFNAYPVYTSGKWHRLHHTHYPCNFGIITPLWDIVFKTCKKL